MKLKQLKKLILFNPDVPDKGHHYTYRVFPFCPGIAWKLKDDKFIRPTLRLDAYKHLIHNKDLVVAAYGGVFESIMSLSIFEMLQYINPDAKLYWSGHEKYNELVKWQGLAKVGPTLPENIRHLFPVPIFQDRDNRAYFNCLNNYKKIISWDKLSKDVSHKILPAQLFQNTCLGWNSRYLPQFRHFTEPPKYFQWQKEIRFEPRRPSILLFPDEGMDSIHTEAIYRTLDWFPVDVRRFADLSFGSGLQIIVVTDRPEKYRHSNLILLPNELSCILPALKQVKYVMSRRIDWLILTLMFSDATLISHPQIYDGNLETMKEYFQKENDIQYFRDVTPEQLDEHLRHHA
jgi:hypothetical protein